MKKRNRGLIYGIGILVLALGLTLNTKAGLGMAPIMSLSYSISYIWNLNLGDATLVLYCILIAAQFIIRGKKRQWRDLLQLPFSLVFSRVLNIFDALIVYDAAVHNVWINLAVLVLAILTIGLGVSMTVNMQLVPNPGDGIVQAIAQRLGWEQGFAKNVFDVGCVVSSCLMGLIFVHRVVGISIGTLCSMVGVGRMVALANYLFKKKMCRAAGLAV